MPPRNATPDVASVVAWDTGGQYAPLQQSSSSNSSWLGHHDKAKGTDAEANLQMECEGEAEAGQQA